MTHHMDYRTRDRILQRWDSFSSVEQEVMARRIPLSPYDGPCGDDGWSVEEVALNLGITREEVRRAESHVLSVVRHPAWGR